MSVVLSEHLPLLASAPDGIQKLRGLILELAVRGKLVPQDPDDEPASELLKRIAQERVQLDGAATRKKKEHTALEGGESPVSVFADGWDTAPLGEVVEIVRGITFPSSEKSKTPEHGRIRCLRTANVQDSIEWGDILYIRSEFVSRNDQMLRSNDIVMSMANSRELVGKVALVEGHLDEAATFGGFLGVLRPHLILPRFVMAFLRAPTVRASLIDSASQTTNIANISLAKLRPLGFPIPPLAEQHRIVAKVDELMALCDRLEAEQTDAEAAHARLVETLLGTLTQSADAAELADNWQRLAEHFDTLFTTESSLDALKQTILQLAVMGRLVPQDPNDEPASELLKRIAKERARLEEEGVCKKLKAMPTVGADEKPFPIPDCWKWVRVEEISQLVTDGEHATPTRTSDRTAIPLVTAKNVRDGYLDYAQTDFVPKEVAEKCWKRCKPTAGDILLVSVGATLGRLSVLDHDQDMVLVRSVTVIRPCLVDRNYFAEALRSPILQKTIWGGVKQSAQPCLYLAQSSSLPIPLPPLAEQHRIVAKIDELRALCDRLKADLAESRTSHARLASTMIEAALETP